MQLGRPLDWNPETETLGEPVEAQAEPAEPAVAAPDLSPRRPGETRRDFNARMARAMNFDSVAAMWEEFPDLEKESKREQRAEAAEKRLQGPGRPPGLPKP